ncbi:MAG: UPF0280 family protein [Burkholderiaceae bacterium]|nr:UPF0280 family protein [Burkholderiaceae bacterium]
MSAQRRRLPDGRWHLQHGPIDIVIGADGRDDAVQAAHEAAWQRLCRVLDELVAELPSLREPIRSDDCRLHGPIARRMWAACAPYYRSGFITPMAAVAGAVAQELVAHYRRDGVDRAWINNGGDVALHLAPGQALRVGIYADIARLDEHEVVNGIACDGSFEVTHPMAVRGVATSGWRGRSFSLGIADSVTVLAATAAQADAAATIVANAVDVDDPRIVRRPACELRDDVDLGAIPVTVDVPRLGPATVQRALDAGLRRARALQREGLVDSCALVCQGMVAIAGPVEAAAEGGVERAIARPADAPPAAARRLEARGAVFS